MQTERSLAKGIAFRSGRATCDDCISEKGRAKSLSFSEGGAAARKPGEKAQCLCDIGNGFSTQSHLCGSRGRAQSRRGAAHQYSMLRFRSSIIAGRATESRRRVVAVPFSLGMFAATSLPLRTVTKSLARLSMNQPERNEYRSAFVGSLDIFDSHSANHAASSSGARRRW